MTSDDPILDGELIQRLRLDLGLSLREMAKRCGTYYPTYKAIEEGKGDGHLPLRIPARIAAALGVEIQDLLEQGRREVTPAPDDVRLEAALQQARGPLAARTIAAAFGWTLRRTVAAADDLAERLLLTGARLAREPRYAIRPRPGVLSRRELATIARLDARAKGLTEPCARQLFRALTEPERWYQFVTRAERPAIGQLVNMGLLRLVGGRPVPSPDLTYCLGLAGSAAEPSSSRGGKGAARD